jgi:hypothetical protein
MTANDFLAHLEGVRPRGPGRWTAKCAAHTDKTPSLSITEGERGILLRCWAGCSIDEICHSLGIEQRELFFDGLATDPRQRRAAAQRRADERARLEEKRHRDGLRLDIQREAERLIASACNIDISCWSDDRLDQELNRLGAAYAVLEGDPYHER